MCGIYIDSDISNNNDDIDDANYDNSQKKTIRSNNNGSNENVATDPYPGLGKGFAIGRAAPRDSAPPKRRRCATSSGGVAPLLDLQLC